jgi:hypothetical protein
MTIRRLLRGAAVPAAGIMLALAGLAPAQAASAPRWDVAAVITPPTGSLGLTSVVATSKTDVWSAGVIFSEVGKKAQTRLLVEQFDGHRWRQFPLPTRLQAVNLNAQVLIGASSASNVWVFELTLGHAQRILRWNGHRWIVMSAPAWVYRTAGGGTADGVVAAFGASGTWIFSLGARDQPSEAARYLHGKWRVVHLPAIPVSVDPVSANDIWASGATDDLSAPVIMHWNGRSWTDTAAPGTDLNSTIASQNQGSAWLLTAFALEHWNGQAWTSTPLPSDLSLGMITADGRGGVWLWGLHQSGALLYSPYVFADYNNGTWSRQTAPAVHGNQIPLAHLSLVPGTTTVYAAGMVALTSRGESGAILRYGS